MASRHFIKVWQTSQVLSLSNVGSRQRAQKLSAVRSWRETAGEARLASPKRYPGLLTLSSPFSVACTLLQSWWFPVLRQTRDHTLVRQRAKKRSVAPDLVCCKGRCERALLLFVTQELDSAVSDLEAAAQLAPNGRSAVLPRKDASESTGPSIFRGDPWPLWVDRHDA